MTKELEALLTELYVLIDDQVVEPRQGRGRRPELSDSELLCLAVAQMLLGFHSERRWVRHAQGNADLRKNVPLHASATRVPQAVEGLARAAVQHDSGSGQGLPVMVGRPVDHRCDPGALWNLTGDRQTLGPGRARRIRVLRELLALLLGSETLLGLRRRRDANHVVPGPPQDR